MRGGRTSGVVVASRVGDLVARYWFLLALGTSLAIGFGLTDTVRPLAESSLARSSLTASVLFLMGLTLSAGRITNGLRHPLPSLLAILINTLLVPLLALPALWLLSTEMAGGLIVTALVPCTLASAAVWTRKGGGDEAVAMIASVTTNLACFLVVPLGLWLILGRVAEISATDQIVRLLLWVVIPMVLGQLARRVALQRWASQRAAQLSLAAQFGILVMVCFGSVASADSMRRASGAIERAGTSAVQAEAAPAVISHGKWIADVWGATLLAIVIHCLAFWFSAWVSRAAGASRPAQLAVAVAGSQKTLMVGLQIALDCGVSVLPMIIYHVSQLVIDTFFVSCWAAQNHSVTAARD